MMLQAALATGAARATSAAGAARARKGAHALLPGALVAVQVDLADVSALHADAGEGAFLAQVLERLALEAARDCRLFIVLAVLIDLQILGGADAQLPLLTELLGLRVVLAHDDLVAVH